MALAFQIDFQKEPGRNDARASWSSARTGLAARRIKTEGVMGRFTSQGRRATFVRPTTDVQNVRHPAAKLSVSPGSEKDIAEKFSAVVTRYSKNDLAEIANRTPEAAKHWKEATRAPNSSSLLKMAKQVDVIREFVLAEIGVVMPTPAPNADKGAAAIAMLQAIALRSDEAGAMARASLSAIHAGGN